MASPNESIQSSIRGTEYESRRVAAFNFRYSMQKRNLPSFFAAKTTGLDYSALDGLITPAAGQRVQHALHFLSFKVNFTVFRSVVRLVNGASARFQLNAMICGVNVLCLPLHMSSKSYSNLITLSRSTSSLDQ